MCGGFFLGDPGGIHHTLPGDLWKINKIKYIRLLVRGALLAANANNGANAGFGYLNTNNRSSNANANIGFRFYREYSPLYEIQYFAPATLPHRICLARWADGKTISV